ncbi:MAG: exopolyphosphatase [Propionibacteriaceae bacterium]|jgi:exopolyphosphatase/guanosine-5'-triphosphate,3'-diphosphate pyrophosphatase|nr:exopolyphosphatase [Propionibacteriaceae bacterium]
MSVAVVDCGTNTIRLLVAEPGDDGLVTLVRELRYVRLGQGVDANRRFHPEALARVFAAADDFARLIADHEVDRTRCLATSAARDVANRDEFLDGMRQRLGVAPEIVSGEQEARLSFLGALAGGPTAPGPVLVSDIGGGSTEIVLGDHFGRVEAARSLDIGSVRLRERCLSDDPPTPAQITAARALVANCLDRPGGPLARLRERVDTAAPVTWIGVAGTSTSIAALAAGLTVYDPAVVHNSMVAPAAIAALSDHLLTLTAAEVGRQYPILPPLRAEVIAGGVLIAAELARRLGRPMTARETDILDGAALDTLQ